MLYEVITIQISDAAVQWLATLGYDPQFGARPVNRLLQKFVLNELSKEILSGQVSADQEILIDLQNEELVFRKA